MPSLLTIPHLVFLVPTSLRPVYASQATWAEETGDSKAAATIYSAVGQTVRAVHILGERGLYNQLIELVRTLPSAGGTQRDDSSAALDENAAEGSSLVSSRGDGGLSRDVKDALGAAGNYFRTADLSKFARECFVKLGDNRAMVQVRAPPGQPPLIPPIVCLFACPRVCSFMSTPSNGPTPSHLHTASKRKPSLGLRHTRSLVAHRCPKRHGSPCSLRHFSETLQVRQPPCIDHWALLRFYAPLIMCYLSAAAKALVAHTHLSHAEWLAVMDRYEEAQVRVWGMFVLHFESLNFVFPL